MALTSELKEIVLLFLHFIPYATSMLTHTGAGGKIHNLKVSNAQESVALYWPKGIVTYYFDNVTYDDYIAQRIHRAINILETVSCVKFKPALEKPEGNMTWIHFTNPQGERNCVHEPKFKEDGEITLVLGFDCLKAHEILHALLHAIGFKDEVSHPQRDRYIRVMWNNIQPEYRYLYRIRPGDKKNSQLLVEYDPLSIMHFHDRAFSINGQATVMALVPGLLISPSDNLSQLDKMRLRLLFGHECNKRQIGDMIDTCKMLLSTKDGPNSKDTSNSQYEENSNSGQADKVNSDGKEDEDSEGDTDGKVEKSGKGDKSGKVDKGGKVDGGSKSEIVKDNEANEGESVDVSISIGSADTDNKDDEANDTDSQKSIKNQNETDKQNSSKVSNRLKYLNDRYDINLGEFW